MSTPLYDDLSDAEAKDDNVTKNEAGEATLEPTNKVRKGIYAAAAVTVLVAVLSAVTPEMFSFAGQFTPLIFAAVTALVTLGTTYLAKPVG